MNVNDNTNSRFFGKRYICLVRQSNDSDGDWSTQAQLKWMHEEGKRLGMIHVEDVVLVGVTGSLPGKRRDLERLLRMKEEMDNFDVLLVQRIDRATRGGPKHGFWLEYEFDRLDIILHYVGEDLPENPEHADLIKTLKYGSARDQARAIGQRSTQGFLHALSQDRCLTTTQTPFGCDRLYFSADGKPLFRIRALPDGTQEQLDVDGKELIGRFGRKARYRKQKDQKPLIVPGEPRTAEAVRLMFRLHYEKRLGGRRIAWRLNEMGVPSPRGLEWSQRQVESIYENPIYCGIALGGVRSQGIFYKRGNTKPEQAEISAHDLASRSGAPVRLRPPEEWVWTDQPLMEDFLPKRVRDKALPEIRKVHTDRWLRSKDPSRPKRSSSKHKASQYVLTGLLEAKQDGEKLSGVLCGKVGKKKRKYRHLKSRRDIRRNSIYNRYIDAQSLEDAVLWLILRVVQDAPDMRKRVADALQGLGSATDAEAKLQDLQQQRESIAKRLQTISLTMTDEDLDDIMPVLDKLRRQRRLVDAQIEKISEKVVLSSADPEEIVDAVMGQLAHLPDEIDTLDTGARRDLIEAFVEKVVIDMETKGAEVFLRLPPWALKSASGPAGKGRLAHNSLSPNVDETHPLLSISLGLAGCEYHRSLGERKVCYRCRRRAA